MNLPNANRNIMQSLEEVFLQVIEIDAAEDRKAFIRQACSEDKELRAKLDKMVTAHFGEDAFLDANNVADSVLPQIDVPQAFGEFEVIREIGRGGMGIVYEAQQQSLNRRVALKVLSVGLDFSSKSIARFQREAEAAAKLHHTNIVPIHTTGIENQIPFYAMELVRGPSLDLVLDQLRGEASTEPKASIESECQNNENCSERLFESETVSNSLDNTPTGSSSFGSGMAYYDNVARMFAEVADALEHAHQEGVIHRDIKPSNLLLGPDGRIHINDFGLARMLEEPSMTMTGELMGSPRYMSPEQISAEDGEVDHRADIYSLGVTLYELITLKPAYDAKERDRIFSQILNKEPEAPRKVNAKIPVDLETICQKAIQKAPADRYQTAAEFAEDLRRFVNRRSVTAKRIGWLGRTAKWCRRNRSLSAVSAILVLVLLVGGTWFTIQEARRHQNWKLVATEIESQLEDDAWQARLLIDSAFGRFPRHNQELSAMLSRIGRKMKIESEPAGAEIFVRPQQFEHGRWLSLGATPIETNLPEYPFQDYHVRAKLDGDEELVTAKTTGFGPVDTWQLDISSRPAMVVVGPAATDSMLHACRVFWLMNRRVPLEMPTFHIDTHEVTNGQFQEFVDSGGYEKAEYWRETLGEDWRNLVERFKDRNEALPGPATWADGTYPPGMRDHPVVGVSWYEAMAYARFKKKQLPTLFHWLRAADLSGWSPEFDSHNRYNIGRKQLLHRPVSQSMRSANYHGVLDTVGNVKEWCLNEGQPGYRYAMGGSWLDDDGSAFNPVTLKPTERRPDVGFRCADYEPTPDWAVSMPAEYRELPTEATPIPEEYVEQFRFDRGRPWKTSPPTASTFHGVEAQHVEFDAGYGEHERIGCYIMFPDREKYAPPFQVMIGSSPIFLDENGKPTTDDQRFQHYSPMMAGGRVLVLPTYWGLSHDRPPGDFKRHFPTEQPSEVYIDGVTKMAKDLIRTVDFFHEEYPNVGGKDLLDTDKLIFVSCGCLQSECMVVADKLVARRNRFAATFFFAGGIRNEFQPPEVDQLTYLPHLDTPTVVINSAGNLASPLEYSQKGMLKLLPMPARLKKLYSIPGFQWGGFPLEHVEREGNSWLDQLETLGKPRTVGSET
ncbi:MAG: protein kinase [Planctomycetales bacterium]|nr:protein kinase [Planctomycetales bacterium]